jgi:hypothetical protein
MIHVTFVGEVQRNIRRKLQKLEWFAGMNASQLLKVVTKMFVNWDQEAQKKVERKIKKEVDLLAAALNGWGGHSSSQSRGQGREKGQPLGNSPQAWSKGSETLKKKSMCLLLPRGKLEKWMLTAPAQAQRCKRERGLCGAPRHWVGQWLGLTGLFPFQLQEPVVYMTVGSQPVDFMVDTGAEYLVMTQQVAPI